MINIKYNGSAWIDMGLLSTTKIEGIDISEFIFLKGVLEFISLISLKGVDLENMTLKEFFEEFTTDELCDMYINRIQNDLAKESLKEIIMERLELPDEASFKLYIELF